MRQPSTPAIASSSQASQELPRNPRHEEARLIVNRNPEPSGYSRDETIAVITEYYDFLVDRGLLPASAILRPPADGWPELPEDSLSRLGRTPAVNDLIRHLPFVKYRNIGGFEIYWLTTAVDYRTVAGVNGEDIHNLQESFGINLAPSVMVYAMPAAEYGCWIYFDVENNTMILLDLNYGLSPVSLGEVPNHREDWPEEEGCCLMEIYTLRDFFERMKGIFRRNELKINCGGIYDDEVECMIFDASNA
ncbi:hypothetical protein I7I51_04434 [Histoplasma capsulatum]|uniref:Uncharacterized protein n=1 Tax=Ajellomyces capsulatus TaxID=5037 RepID=A0A8A1MDM5_AJECA|nr:predicted protein [Histoplasma mississippiense (nom. inval.)]EDN07656.1 predicted protein [Histoplasma mississippiense (nom. inval.)]QSS62257.1 hypothetical protein I7I51_04434 [Histoplasma capsulatum]